MMSSREPVYVMTHSQASRDSFVFAPWPLQMRDMSHAYVWRDSCIFSPYFIYTCDVTENTFQTSAFSLSPSHTQSLARSPARSRARTCSLSLSLSLSRTRTLSRSLNTRARALTEELRELAEKLRADLLVLGWEVGLKCVRARASSLVQSGEDS